MQLQLPTGRGKKRRSQLVAFANQLIAIYNQMDMKVSSRGWCYQLEGFGLITKAEFDKIEKIINDCRKDGSLPVDFVLEEDARLFSGVEIPEERTPLEYFADCLDQTIKCYDIYTPDWWDGEEYYIQMLVEKIDLKSLFEPICKQYHIPIATSKGWSSIYQRAKYARRFKEADRRGLKCVLLYCGDHDPDGLRISDTIRKNLLELSNIHWIDGKTGYNPYDLIIDRFGLDYDFIIENKLSWIENLITGSKKNLADPKHPNHKLPYVQDYIKKYGIRKCEANALIIKPEQGRQLCREAIELYLDHDAINRFKKKRKAVEQKITDYLEKKNLKEPLQKIIDEITGGD
jgi:hypothetical protein